MDKIVGPTLAGLEAVRDKLGVTDTKEVKPIGITRATTSAINKKVF